MAGHVPTIRLLMAGRVFRPDAEDAVHQKGCYQVKGLTIELGADVGALKATVDNRLLSVLGYSETDRAPTVSRLSMHPKKES